MIGAYQHRHVAAGAKPREDAFTLKIAAFENIF